MKRFNNEVVNGYNGKALVMNNDGKQEEMKLSNVLYTIMNGMSIRTQKDSIECAKLSRVLDKVVGEELKVIEMEDGTHDWLKLVAENVTPSLFRVNGNVVYVVIKEGFIKEEQSKKLK